MKELGSTKIGKQVPKPSFIYPMIRLPQSCVNIVGETVKLYETEHEGRQAFLIVVDKEIVQPVEQSHNELSYEQRIAELEKRIRTMEGRGSTIYPALSSERAESHPPCKGDVITN